MRYAGEAMKGLVVCLLPADTVLRVSAKQEQARALSQLSSVLPFCARGEGGA